MNHPDYDPDQFPHWTSIPVRYRDLDTLNHVNNALFSTFYEEARIDFIQQVPEMADAVGRTNSFVLAGVCIDFIHPVEYPATLEIGTGIREFGNTSITSFQAIYLEDSKTLVSTAESSGVWYDLDKRRPGRLPDLGDGEQFMVGFEQR